MQQIGQRWRRTESRIHNGIKHSLPGEHRRFFVRSDKRRLEILASEGEGNRAGTAHREHYVQSTELFNPERVCGRTTTPHWRVRTESCRAKVCACAAYRHVRDTFGNLKKTTQALTVGKTAAFQKTRRRHHGSGTNFMSAPLLLARADWSGNQRAANDYPLPTTTHQRLNQQHQHHHLHHAKHRQQHHHQTIILHQCQL